MTTTDKIAYVRQHNDAPLADLAKAMKCTNGKAAFVKMIITVEDTPQLKITGRNEREIVKKAVTQRKRADEHSSWGWLSARTGISEPRLKKLAAEKTGYPVFGDRIATTRAAKRNKK